MDSLMLPVASRARMASSALSPMGLKPREGALPRIWMQSLRRSAVFSVEMALEIWTERRRRSLMNSARCARAGLSFLREE